MRNKHFFKVLGLALIFSPFNSYSEVRPQLAPGMTASQVRAKWGEPQNKIEKELRRERIWQYKDGSAAYFHEGKLHEWQLGKDVEGFDISKESIEPLYATPHSDSSETLDLVRDIAREVPSGPDSPSGSAPDAQQLLQPVPVQQPPVQPPNFQGFQGPPPIQPPVYDEDVE